MAWNKDVSNFSPTCTSGQISLSAICMQHWKRNDEQVCDLRSFTLNNSLENTKILSTLNNNARKPYNLGG